jgi:hypothetical protein
MLGEAQARQATDLLLGIGWQVPRPSYCGTGGEIQFLFSHHWSNTLIPMPLIC